MFAFLLRLWVSAGLVVPACLFVSPKLSQWLLVRLFRYNPRQNWSLVVVAYYEPAAKAVVVEG